MEYKQPNISYEDFDNICRICLLSEDLEPFKKLDVYHVLRRISPEDFQEELEDKLPNSICQNCIEDIENVSNFLIKFQTSDQILKLIIKTDKNIDKRELNNEIRDGDTNYSVPVIKNVCHVTENEKRIEVKKQLRTTDDREQNSSKNNLNGDKNRTNKSISNKLFTYDYTSNEYKSEDVEKNDEVMVIKYIDEQSEKLCGENCEYLNKFKHVNGHKRSTFFQCTYCDKGFRYRNNWKCHVSTHIYKTFTCSICKWAGSNQDTLNVHIKNTHKDQELKLTIEQLKRDSAIQENKSRTLLCNICGKKFNRKSTLDSHIKIHIGEKKFECGICGFRFILKCTLNRHLAVHKKEKNFKCGICGKCFSQKRYLLKHIQVFHGTEKRSAPKKEKQGSYYCSVCSRGFLTRKWLKRHESTHNTKDSLNVEIFNNKSRDTKDFLCTQCGKQFTLKCNLNRHISTTHSGEKPFECDVCGDRFTVKLSLDCHLNIHNGIKPYQCKRCLKSFRQPSSLRKHVLVHTGERQYKCHICEMAFKTSSHLKTHFKRHAKS